MDILIKSGIKKVQLHAFDGGKKSIRQGINAGFFFSIGNKVFEDKQTKNLVEMVPLSQLLLETDSPDMGLNETRNTFSTISFHFSIEITVSLIALYQHRRRDSLHKRLFC